MNGKLIEQIRQTYFSVEITSCLKFENTLPQKLF